MPLSVSIHLSVPSWQDRWLTRARRATHWARTLVVGNELPSYTRSREALGGEPWRRLDHTERWFVSSAAGLAASPESAAILVGEPAAAPESAPQRTNDSVPDLSVDLRTPWLSRRSLAIGSAALGLTLALALIGGQSPPSQGISSSPSSPSSPSSVVLPAPIDPVVRTRPTVPKLVAHHSHKRRTSRHARRL